MHSISSTPYHSESIKPKIGSIVKFNYDEGQMSPIMKLLDKATGIVVALDQVYSDLCWITFNSISSEETQNLMYDCDFRSDPSGETAFRIFCEDIEIISKKEFYYKTLDGFKTCDKNWDEWLI
jgi:hypothetical protein